MKHIKTYILALALTAVATASAQTVFTLPQAIEAACQNNSQLQKRRLSEQSMALTKKELYTKYFPSASLSFTGFMRNKGLFEGSPILDWAFTQYATLFAQDANANFENVQILKYGAFGGLKITQPIYTGGRLTAANSLAKLGQEAATELTALQEEDVRQEVEKYFWQLVQLYEADRSLLTMDSLFDRAQHDASLALKAGLVTTNDEMQVKLHGSELESMHLKLGNGQELCKEYLAYLLGVEKVDSIVWDDIYKVEKPEHFLVNPDAALLDRHELKLLQMRVDAAQLQKKYTRGGLLPTVGAFFNLSYHYLWAKNEGGYYNSQLDNNNFGWMLGASVSVPLTAWWGGSYALKRSNISIQQAQIERDDKQKLMRVQVTQKWSTLNEKYKQIDVAKRQLQQAEQNQKQQASAYRSGAITMTDRLQADALYEKSRTNYIDACIKYRTVITEYLHATGR